MFPVNHLVTAVTGHALFFVIIFPVRVFENGNNTLMFPLDPRFKFKAFEQKYGRMFFARMGGDPRENYDDL